MNAGGSPAAPAPPPARPAWIGGYRPYDILKEGTIAFVIITILTVVLAAVLSSPDVPAVTIQGWARADPADFLATAASELDHTSETATYGPPYNDGRAYVTRLGPVSLQRLGGITEPVHPARDFVLHPLAGIAGTDPALAGALATYNSADPTQQDRWASAYAAGLAHARFVQGSPVLPAGPYGPVPLLMRSELALARDGGLETDLLTSHSFYGTNFTKPLLFLADGDYFSNLATAQHMQGDQWGMMNETGSYPGQPWLWLYTFWYQIKPMSTSRNGDVEVMAIMAVLTMVFVFVPFIPGLRGIPRKVGLYRLIWRDYYRRSAQGPPA